MPRADPADAGDRAAHAAELVSYLSDFRRDVVAEPLRLLVRVGVAADVDQQRRVVDGAARLTRPGRSARRAAARSGTGAARAPSADRSRDRCRATAPPTSSASRTCARSVSPLTRGHYRVKARFMRSRGRRCRASTRCAGERRRWRREGRRPRSRGDTCNRADTVTRPEPAMGPEHRVGGGEQMCSRASARPNLSVAQLVRDPLAAIRDRCRWACARHTVQPSASLTRMAFSRCRIASSLRPRTVARLPRCRSMAP